ncbi:hypothetical protein PRUPE_7G250900 [Prunus persica]|uniref:RING-type domain-containing protein n=6 Tax=Prunus TaxID=3754 RepID=A0A6J5VIA3_PRUAR|nr:PREDICTED: uncharacterized protein LOC103341139 isoform X1 [Prunus mume]XP_020423721.1 uncharacterized protein LOC18771652 isoform X1 [Prunus persica]XP_034223939.1 uncharacterized protein LOC117634120 isoform X1 [Prunus dulcis]CAB4288700.1 unnamed protein product [Prunus armeniaca]KAI5320669.1 hypothetical protein L3X38_040377 [Prunus dulcis]ONH98481.1 hypothetical protein PRUPE_7G250900 [Prunus persica]CAB4319066.1 unnamed protein product [Prunus armeniaca]VVA10825.1 PREDICTED: RING/U-b
MGKRKLPSDHSQTHPPPFSPHPSDLADIMPCSSGMELLSQEKPLHSVDSGEQLKSLSSVLDSTDSSLKLLNAHPSVAQQHHPSLGRSTFFKRSRHHYAHQYSRRNSGNLANTSTSRGKGVPLRDDKLSYKLATQSNSESRRHSEIRENPFLRQPRIRSSYLTTDAASPDPGKMVCEICEKLLRRKPFLLGSTLSSTEVSVVAVLGCGHAYHADCLEQKTSFEDRRDPHCPLCLGLLPKVEDSREQV